MYLGDQSRRVWWLVGAGVVALAGVVGVLVLGWLLVVQVPGVSDRWLEPLALSPVVAAAFTVAAWMVRRGRPAVSGGEEAVLSRLREAVDLVWSREVAARLNFPRFPGDEIIWFQKGAWGF